MTHRCAIALILAGLLPRLACAQGAFHPLSNGRTLAGWDGDPSIWKVVDGVIVGEATAAKPLKQSALLIWTNGMLDDFELRCQVRLTSNGTKGFAAAGIQYRNRMVGPGSRVIGGYRAVIDAEATYNGILFEEHIGRGILAMRGERLVWDSNCIKRAVGHLGNPQAGIRKNDWNDYVIRAHGNHLEHFVNGEQTVDVTDNCISKRATNGLLALQLPAGGAMKVEFRNIQLARGSADSQIVTAELKKLQGSWQVTDLEADGLNVPKELLSPVYLTLKGREFELFNAGVQITGTVSLDPSKRPPQIDIHCQSGPHKGETLPGIYELSDNGLRLCYSQLVKNRPKAFTTADGVGLVLVDSKRKKI